MLSEEQEKELLKMLEDRKKWKYFCEIMSRKYVFFPFLAILIGMVDNPDLYIIKSLVTSIKKWIGI